MRQLRRQAKPFSGGLIAPALLLTALTLAPALAETPARSPADNPWCGDGRHLTLAQRISGCSAILALQRAIIEVWVVGYDWRGRFYAGQQEYGAALSDFSAAIDLDASYAMAYAERADVYLVTGNSGPAIED
jgi:hypothetical protein